MPGVATTRAITGRHLAETFPAFQAILDVNIKGSPGYGNWLWKPFIVHEYFQRSASQGRGLIYLDAGCEINRNPVSTARWLDYQEIAQHDGVLAMRLDQPLNQWCKNETLGYFGFSQEDAKTLPVIEPGVLFLAPNDISEALVHEWSQAIYHREGRLFRDPHDFSKEDSTFIAHRHDQAVFSCLMGHHRLSGIESETYFGPKWKGDAGQYPIWVMRNRYPFSIRPRTWGGTLILIYKKFRSLALGCLKDR